MSIEYKIGDILTVKIEKIVPRGLGLAFAENLTVFVPLTVPSDRLHVRISQIKKRTAFAEIVEIIEPAPKRIEPPCPHFGICGGCDFQQMDYATQIEAKVGMIRDCLHRIGKIEFEPEIPILPSPMQFQYRSRARWHADRIDQAIGYFKRDSHDVIDVAECPILTPEMQSALENLRQGVDWAMLWDDSVEIEAASGDGGQVSIFSADESEPTAEITFTAVGETYTFSAKTFFQGNHFLIGQLIDTALKGAAGETALDLFCGVGLFSIPLARAFRQVIGVEGNDKAIDFAEKNASASGAANIRFVQRGVGEFLSGHNLEDTDFVLLDPPRAGAEKETIRNIVQLKPKQISYVSCEPSILARDLRTFLDGGYAIESITALDLFPQTHHVETVVRLALVP